MATQVSRSAVIRAELARTDHCDPAQLPALAKHQKMAQQPFRFLRGSAGLFYLDIKTGVLAIPAALQQWPLTTVVGDCHLSNFGFFTEEGSSGERVIFAPNDFDDACVGQASWDLSRFMVSLLLAADYCRGVLSGAYPNEEGLVLDGLQAATEAQAAAALHAFLNAYRQQCKAIVAEPELRYSALDDFPKSHVLKPLLKKAIKRSAKGDDFLRKSTLAKLADLSVQPLQFKQDARKFTRLPAEEYQAVSHSFRPYLNDHILDLVSRQGAGTGSLNMKRYYFLVGPAAIESEDDFSLCHVVEAKQQRDAAPLYHFPELSPVNRLNAAHLTVDCQRQMQRRPDLVLDEHYFNGAHFLVRSLHHANVDVDPETVCLGEVDVAAQLRDYATACGQALALCHSRGDRRSFRFEQAVVDSLPEVAAQLVESCQAYARQQAEDCRLLQQLLAEAH
ncbi:DUF2252 family protein [Rheinheimera marina]|uniref:DUF2252 family protein n=1 Tax=Rheinheimera marina TaxID=1774958 RepID=A0ABV9JQ16_9GAMM